MSAIDDDDDDDDDTVNIGTCSKTVDFKTECN